MQIRAALGPVHGLAHSRWLAIRAPSTNAANFAQTIEGCTSFDPANDAKPQSALAITRSRPTMSAKRRCVAPPARMLHQHGRLGDHAGHEHLVVGQLGPLPFLPLVLMPRVRGLERVAAGTDLENDIDDVFQLHVVNARAHVHAVAGVEPDRDPSGMPASAVLRASTRSSAHLRQSQCSGPAA